MASDGLPIDRTQAAERLAAAGPQIADRLVRPLLEMLRHSRTAFDGDIDKFLIMLTVAQRTAEDPRFTAYSIEQLESGAVPVFPSLGLNMRSIAESIGAPRESVRRKVGELVAAGWIDRGGRDLRFTLKAFVELTVVRHAIHTLAIRNYEVVRGVLEADPDPPLTVPA